MTPYLKNDIISRLNAAAAQKRGLVFCGVGAPFLLNSADNADVAVCYGSSILRTHGFGSMYGTVDLCRLNDLVLNIGRQLTAADTPPVLAGVFCAEPGRDYKKLFSGLIDAGYSGIMSCPTISMLDGPMRSAFEQSGRGIAMEASNIKLANELGLFTAAMALSPHDAAAMADAGADAIVWHYGMAADRRKLPEADAAQQIAALSEGLGTPGKKPIIILHGGPTIRPESLTEIYSRCAAAGVLCGSTADSLPITEAVASTVRSYQTEPSARVYVSAGCGAAAAAAAKNGAAGIIASPSEYGGHPAYCGVFNFQYDVRGLLRLARALIAKSAGTPVIVPAACYDVTRDMERLFASLRALGAAGILACPSLSCYTGDMRQALSDGGMLLERELAVLSRARAHGMQAWAYVCSAEDALICGGAAIDAAVVPDVCMTDALAQALRGHPSHPQIIIERVSGERNPHGGAVLVSPWSEARGIKAAVRASIEKYKVLRP